MEESTESQNKQMEPQKCFVIMPISDPDGYDKGHFKKVYEDIIAVACKSAGFMPERADNTKESNLIHLDILKRLIESPLAICDLSSRNPNVLFELGIRQAFDKPTVLIQESGTPQIFDIASIRTISYSRELKYRDVLNSQNEIKDVILATMSASVGDKNGNSIINLLSISKANVKEISEGNANASYMQLIMQEVSIMRNELRKLNIPKNVLHNKDELKKKDFDNSIDEYFIKALLEAKIKFVNAINEDLGELAVKSNYEEFEKSVNAALVFADSDIYSEMAHKSLTAAKAELGRYMAIKFQQREKQV